MNTFDERYKKLNEAQKKAVDTVEGPVLVVAGPGSGKTELLSLRVANILRLGNVGPQNILCLTFTENAALNMRDRLSQLIGTDAYRVGIFTFHAFCSHIISRFPEYFYNAATFTNVSDITRAEILESLFSALPHKHPFASFHPETGYVYLHDVKERIKHIKNGGYTPEEFRSTLELILKDYDVVHTVLADWPENMRAKTSIEEVKRIESGLKKIKDNVTASLLLTTLTPALTKALEENKTAALTTWQNLYTVKGVTGRILKEYSKVESMRAMADLYQSYTEMLHAKGYYDYDDMIIDVSHALRQRDILRAEIEEQYQYVLIDEFQDTNEAQMDVVRAITQNPVYEGQPNVCVVGDDDQAIYKFQGAEVSHMIHFRDALYRNVQTIVLNKNYRSTQNILSVARNVITQGSVRLENKYTDITKVLSSENKTLPKGNVRIESFLSDLEEYHYVVNDIKKILDGGEKPEEIAIIAREHKQLQATLPFLEYQNIPYSYIKKTNVFDEKHIQELIVICEYLGSGISYEVLRNDLLPRILSFSFWNISRVSLFGIAETVKREHISWSKALAQSDDAQVKKAFEILMKLSIDAATAPLEHILEQFMKESGFKDYYFNENVRATHSQEYVSFLGSLKTFIDALREYKEGEILTVQDVASFVEMHMSHGIPLVSKSVYTETKNAVTLHTAHSSKGLEFGHVYIMNAHEDSWAKPSKRKNKILLPLVLQVLLTPAGDNEDDFIRLLYVAITRAKHSLTITSHKPQVRYLTEKDNAQKTDEDERNSINMEEIISLHEQSLGLAKAPYTEDEKTVFAHLVERYQMPVTHLTNFLNVVDGGPQLFLERNLLRFPEPLNPSGAYGSAIHKAIEEIITYPRFYGGEKPSLEHIIGVFDRTLSYARLPKDEDVRERNRGHELLSRYYEERKDFFVHTDQVEVDMKNEGVFVEEAHLTGKLDFLRTQNNALLVRDFKTGKAFTAWDKAKSDHEKIKLHNQRLQLIFYKILLENSNRFKNHEIQSLTLEYVEGNDDANIIELSLDPSAEDVERTKKLIGIIYKKIISLDFPNIEQYSKDHKGILAFEEDLLTGKI